MQVKDKFFEKINLLILVLTLCFSHNMYAENLYNEIFNYNNTLKNSSAKFIQTNYDYIQEGEIFFGKKRIKITYKNPEKLTLILSEKKGMYINHKLQESEFFLTKKSYIKFFFDIFYTKIGMKNMNIKRVDRQIEINEKIQIDNNFFEIKLIYESEPVKLRRLEIISDEDKIQMGFFDHKFENVFDKSFFSMIDPYLN
jgi:hypothetical protein